MHCWIYTAGSFESSDDSNSVRQWANSVNAKLKGASLSVADASGSPDSGATAPIHATICSSPDGRWLFIHDRRGLSKVDAGKGTLLSEELVFTRNSIIWIVFKRVKDAGNCLHSVLTSIIMCGGLFYYLRRERG